MKSTHHNREIFIGDVHGCYDELQLLLEKINFSKTDTLIFVGDVINKGPKNLEVLQFIKSNQHQVKVIKGNHELKFIEYCQEKSPHIKKQNFENLKKELGDQLEEWLNFIKTWPLFIETEEYIVVHAGLAPNLPIEQIDPNILTNIRTWDGVGIDLNNPADPPWHQLYKQEKLVIYGHWAVQGLFQTKNTIGLDSGCVYGNHLSCYILPYKKIVQVTANKSYK